MGFVVSNGPVSACLPFIPPVCLRGKPVWDSPFRPRHDGTSMEGCLPLSEGDRAAGMENMRLNQEVFHIVTLTIPVYRDQEKNQTIPSASCKSHWRGLFLKRGVFGCSVCLHNAADLEISGR